MVCIWVFLSCYFQPGLLFSPSTTTGGDTGSHYYTAQYLRDVLLPKGRISGWCYGNLCGFPLLQNYFPFPFVLIALLSYGIGLPVAFKLGTVLGIYLLPLCTFQFLRDLDQPFPVPAIGAVFTLPFLFMEGNSMWGGNIPSTLAGTFCYSLALALAVLWLGRLYKCLQTGKGLSGCSVLLAVIGACHGYALLFCGFSSLFFLLSPKRFMSHLAKLIQIHALAIGLMAVWLVPMLAFMPYTTRFGIVWLFFDFHQVLRELLPVVIRPYGVLSLIGLLCFVVQLRRRNSSGMFTPWLYCAFMMLCALGLYAAGFRLKVVDVRFLPFFQFFLVITGALGVAMIRRGLQVKALIAFGFVLLTLPWVAGHETFIRQWIRHNYGGFEQQPLWPSYAAVNHDVKGTAQDPRVVYEHSMVHQRAGTVRAFEMLPCFSGRATLEGVYLQANLCAPFVFYLQSEISRIASMPFSQYNYSRFNPLKAARHMALLNVREYITATSDTRAAVEKTGAFRKRFDHGPYSVFELRRPAGPYVVPLAYRPVLAPFQDWRRSAYDWFRLGDLDVPLVFDLHADIEKTGRFVRPAKFDVRRLPRNPLPSTSEVKTVIGFEEIRISNATPGHPLLVKIAWHPNWKVSGADRIYLATPGFMLIYPQTDRVRLYYGNSWPDYLGWGLTLAALGYLVLSRSRWRIWHLFSARIGTWFARTGVKLFAGLMGLMVVAGGFYLARLSPRYPVLQYNQGLRAFAAGDYESAQKTFKQIAADFPGCIISDQAAYHYAMAFFRQSKWRAAASALHRLLRLYPDSGRVAEAYYHLALVQAHLHQLDTAGYYFRKTLQLFPDSPWAGFAREHLARIANSGGP